MPSKKLRRPLWLAAACAALLLAARIPHELAGPALEGLAYLLPALLLVGLLHARRYPGERLLAAAIARSRPSPGRVLGACGARPPGRWGALLPRGGMLIGCALAVRPPPPAAASPT